MAQTLIARLQAGERIALVSDAGTPAVSDPGARIVDAVRAAGLRVLPLPGASAAVAAISASGLVNGQFYFVGFLPAKARQRETMLQSLRTINDACGPPTAPSVGTSTALCRSSASPCYRACMSKKGTLLLGTQGTLLLCANTGTVHLDSAIFAIYNAASFP